ncbi:hypothetical protein WMY93_004861 [Mugilogobius chulae]|uniref:Uncharacterized protein n=1 Tax=Mugilogobius chulae TaxID=88201 RepID=A0AAW0Q4S9_9GOBI
MYNQSRCVPGNELYKTSSSLPKKMNSTASPAPTKNQLLAQSRAAITQPLRSSSSPSQALAEDFDLIVFQKLTGLGLENEIRVSRDSQTHKQKFYPVHSWTELIKAIFQKFERAESAQVMARPEAQIHKQPLVSRLMKSVSMCPQPSTSGTSGTEEKMEAVENIMDDVLEKLYSDNEADVQFLLRTFTFT